MSGTHRHPDLVPRTTLIGAGALLAFTLAATSIVRIANIAPAASPVLMREQAKILPLASRDLRFVDRADGSVVIGNARGGTVAVIAAGQKTGFVRGVMRGLARDRRARGIDNRPPFTLTLWRDGDMRPSRGQRFALFQKGSYSERAFERSHSRRRPGGARH